MKSPKKITLARIASHDFNRALRIWRTRLSETDILRYLVHERSRALAIAIRSFGIALIGALWLSTAKSTLTLKLAFIDLTMPAAYVNFAVAAAVFGALVHATNYMLLNEFVRVASNKLFRFDSPWVLTVLQDGGSAWSIGAVAQFRFFQSSNAHSRFGKAAVLLANVPFLAMLVAIYWIIGSVGARVLSQDGLLATTSIFTVIAWLIVLYPLGYIALIRFPFSFTKNTKFIRWNFLTRMYRRAGFWPPRVGEWLPKNKAAKVVPIEIENQRRATIEAENEARTAELRRKYGQG
jgi:hypothetical protein